MTIIENAPHDRGGWLVFRGTGEPASEPRPLPPPMPSRSFRGGPPVLLRPSEDHTTARRLGENGPRHAHQLNDDDIELVNAALYLRRPLLVTGSPGLGKSTLAYLVAVELGLGPVLKWAVTSKSVLRDGLYRYDALRRLEEASISVANRPPSDGPGEAGTEEARGARLTDYITLGPLGTALLPSDRPRVLLIDELDKADIDLPNDLLHVFEDGEFEIPELYRIRASRPRVELAVEGSDDLATVVDGRVVCSEFPFVVMTSNGERDFPPAFERRCLRLHLTDPNPEQLRGMIEAHLGAGIANDCDDIIDAFITARGDGTLPADRLLGAVYLITRSGVPDQDRVALARRIMARPAAAG